VDEDGTDVVCVQEPYVIHNKIAGIPRKHKICATGEGRHRAAIVVTNNQIDSLLLRQLSDEGTVLIIRGESVREAENFANVEMSKINAWSKRNKVGFNEAKSKTMLISRRKRKEAKEVKIYLNNKPIKQDTTMKYLGIVLTTCLNLANISATLRINVPS